MLPEKGDKTVTVNVGDVAAALAAVGVRPGDTVLFHSSLSSMGTVEGGPNTVIEGFIEAVGPEGTVVAPTLWWHNADPPLRMEDWDIATSPSYVGLISETLRQRPDSLRSDNPSHSVSAIGRRARELTAVHVATPLRHSPWNRAAFSACSPWQRFYDWNAACCFIGVDLRVGTIRHLVESMLIERALLRLPPGARAAAEDGVVDWGHPGVWPGISGATVDARLTAAGILTFGRIGSATLRCLRTRDFVDTLLTMLETEAPETWFNAQFAEWLGRTRG